MSPGALIATRATRTSALKLLLADGEPPGRINAQPRYVDSMPSGVRVLSIFTGGSRQSGLRSDSRARRKLGFWDEMLGCWDFRADLKRNVGTAENRLNRPNFFPGQGRTRSGEPLLHLGPLAARGQRFCALPFVSADIEAQVDLCQKSADRPCDPAGTLPDQPSRTVYPNEPSQVGSRSAYASGFDSSGARSIRGRRL